VTVKKIGIIGGGQLGRMISMAAHAMGFEIVVFTNEKNSPASFVTNNTILANFDDEEALKKFAASVDVATFEFENIPFETANFVASQVTLFPKAEILRTTQHRILEKNFLNSIGVKTADYAAISSLESLQENLKKFGKAILKTATMGYDGKGQFVLKDAAEAEKAWLQVAGQELILEKFCPFESECSVMVARAKSGEIAVYEPLTNIHKNGILDESIYPAKISEGLKTKAQNIAQKIALELDLVGILAVEMFAIKTKSGDELLVNELAPRPHNSGHFSMDACVTSQFEQLVRAITGLPLGSTAFHSAGLMKNLIGDEMKDLQKFYENPHAKIHLYGKSEIKSGRKMGHVNILV
jgi:5-(carboxyamino)imidazole ribonucleotide synthase